MFPRLSSRGPIEVTSYGRGQGVNSGGFRDYQVAAPLKCVDDPTSRIADEEFPRLSSRGPIEVASGRSGRRIA